MLRERERDRERERERETERERERETERQTDRQTETETDRQTDRQTQTERLRQLDTVAGCRGRRRPGVARLRAQLTSWANTCSHSSSNENRLGLSVIVGPAAGGRVFFWSQKTINQFSLIVGKNLFLWLKNRNGAICPSRIFQGRLPVDFRTK
jgi:hypothetical protein